MKSIAGISEKFRKFCVIHKAVEKVEMKFTCCIHCNYIFNWVEYRPPNFCPECGHKFEYGERHERTRSV